MSYFYFLINVGTLDLDFIFGKKDSRLKNGPLDSSLTLLKRSRTPALERDFGPEWLCSLRGFLKPGKPLKSSKLLSGIFRVGKVPKSLGPHVCRTKLPTKKRITQCEKWHQKHENISKRLSETFPKMYISPSPTV